MDLWYQPSTVGNSGYSIYQDDGAYTKANSITDRFSTPATPPLPGDGIASDMMWADDALFFGYAGKVYKTDGTTLRSIADVTGTGLAVDGRFCITGGEMFLQTGEAIDLRTNTRRNWIRKGQLSAGQTSTEQQLEIAALSSSIFCSSYATGTTLYLAGRVNRSLRVVTPVTR